MAVDIWPSTLPQALLVGLEYTLGDASLRSAMDSGPAKVRSRTSAVPDQISGSFYVSIAQKATLTTFYTVTLLGGSLPFSFPDPDGGADLLCRFTAPPTFRLRAPGLYATTISLESLP